LLEEGFAALSHRAIAARASLPLASNTYYFTSGDDLRDAAVQHLAEEWSARAVGVLPTGVDGGHAAEAIARLVGADATPQLLLLLLLYERYLEVGRQHGRYHPRRGNRLRTHTERRPGRDVVTAPPTAAGHAS